MRVVYSLIRRLRTLTKMDVGRLARSLESDENLTSLMAGSPGAETLRDCKDIMLKATAAVLDQEADITHAFRYGHDKGDHDFCDELAKFLSTEYGDEVKSSNLMVTAGATQALHLMATMLFTRDSVVFMEDPTYFAAARMLSQDLQMRVVPVPCDEDGMDCEELDRLLTENRPAQVTVTPSRPFWGLVYTITVYNNPTGRCYSPNRCRRLVELARKHDVMLLAEDVYNLIHFGDSCPPPRLLSYDRKSDPDYKGHVVSSATFSKILAPGLRLGWIEAPEWILTLLHGSNMAWSGGSLNHYASKLAEAILELGLQTQHLRLLRQVYKKRNDKVCEILKENLPAGAKFEKPQGGFFVWIEFPEDVDTWKMAQFVAQNYKVSFFPGICSSGLGNCTNCARISFSFLPENELYSAVKRFCEGAKAYISQSQETSG